MTESVHAAFVADAGDLPPLLEARGVSKSFPGVKALDDVRLTVRRGRLHAVLGENGAGKSTLMNVLAGVFPPDAGDILLDGKRVSFSSPREARQAGIAIIFQELNLIPELSIAQNVFLGREPLTPARLIDDARMNREASEWLARLRLDADPRTPVSRLRVGQQQVVEIARALSMNARVIIMDEPTSAITEQESALLFELIHRLKREGVAIVYITHKLDELRSIADDVTVLRDGRFIGSRTFAAVTHDEIIRMMVGRDLADLFPKTSVPAGEELFRVRNLSLRHPDRPGDFVFRDISFELRRGEVLGIFGLMGAGRTELLQTIFGLHPRASTGDIQVEGKRTNIRSPRDAIESGLALAPEDRKSEGLALLLGVGDNTTLCSLPKVESVGFLRPRRERELADRYVNRLRIRTPSLSQPVVKLSGGNQQKVVLAKWLATEPKILLLDEPTRGIDINAKKEIYTLITELAQSGLGVIMVSSELPEILAMSDRIIVLAEGRLTAHFHREEATEESILKAALPGGTN